MLSGCPLKRLVRSAISKQTKRRADGVSSLHVKSVVSRQARVFNRVMQSRGGDLSVFTPSHPLIPRLPLNVRSSSSVVYSDSVWPELFGVTHDGRMLTSRTPEQPSYDVTTSHVNVPSSTGLRYVLYESGRDELIKCTSLFHVYVTRPLIPADQIPLLSAMRQTLMSECRGRTEVFLKLFTNLLSIDRSIGL